LIIESASIGGKTPMGARTIFKQGFVVYSVLEIRGFPVSGDDSASNRLQDLDAFKRCPQGEYDTALRRLVKGA